MPRRSSSRRRAAAEKSALSALPPPIAAERIEAISSGDFGDVAVNGADGRVPPGTEGDKVPVRVTFRLPGR